MKRNKFKKDYLDNHVKTESHVSISKLRNSTNQPNIITSFVTQLGVEKSKIITLMRNTYFCSKKYIALNIYLDLNDLVEYQINNYDEINYQTLPTMVLPLPLYTQTLPSILLLPDMLHTKILLLDLNLLNQSHM